MIIVTDEEIRVTVAPWRIRNNRECGFREMRCKRCKQWWHLEAFWHHKRGNYYALDSWCRACWAEIRTPSPNGNALRRRKILVIDGTEYFECKSCKEMKLEDSFSNNKKNYRGKQTYCKDCHNAKQREARRMRGPQSNPKARRYYNRHVGAWMGGAV